MYNGCENTTDIKITGYPVPQWDNDGFDTKNTGKTNYTGNSNGAAIWNYVVSGSQINGSMAIDNAGNIYVSNYNSGNVVKINPSGVASVLVSKLDKPYGLHVEGNMLFITCQGSNSIMRQKL